MWERLFVLIFVAPIVSPSGTFPSDRLWYGSYQKGPVCYPAQPIRYPESTAEINSIIREAEFRRWKVKAFGARHSMTDIICTEGIPIDMRNFQKMALHADDTVTFGAGVTVWDAANYLKAHGRALITAPGYGNITIGGSIGTGAHGSSLKFHSSISEQVVGVTIVDGTGKIHKIHCDIELRALRVHLGLLGIIVDVTLKTMPFYKILAHNYEMPDYIIFDGRLEAFAREADQIMMFWYPALMKVIIANWTHVDAATPGDCHINLLESTTRAWQRKTIDTFESLQKLSPAKAAALVNGAAENKSKSLIDDASQRNSPFYTEDGVTLKNPCVGDWNRMTTSICMAEGPAQCTWLHGREDYRFKIIDYEFAVALEQLPAIAYRLRNILMKAPAAFPIGGILLRFSAKSDIYMSVSEGRDTVHLEVFAVKRRNEYQDPMVWLAAYQTFFQSLVNEFGGRSHWGKSAMYYHSRDMIHKKISRAVKTAFISRMWQYDPKSLFMNHFGQRLREYKTKMDTDPTTTHCALQDNCVCRTDHDCAHGQHCTTLKGFAYFVCANKQN